MELRTTGKVCMIRVGAIVRLLMLAACVVPFTSARQAAAFAPNSPAVPAPTSPAPVQEEEDTQRQEEANGKEKARTPSPPPNRPSAASAQTLYSRPLTAPGTSPAPSPSPIDPFRNGLGCPFRC
jgi:hypothetical protein